MPSMPSMPSMPLPGFPAAQAAAAPGKAEAVDISEKELRELMLQARKDSVAVSLPWGLLGAWA